MRGRSVAKGSGAVNSQRGGPTPGHRVGGRPKPRLGDDAWLWGLRAIHEVIAAAPAAMAEMLVEAGTVTAEVAELVSSGRRAGVPVREVARRGLDGLGAGSHRGLLARLKPYAYAELSTVIESAADLILALDCVQDPHNLGAVLRTGEAAGAGGVLLPRDRSVSVTASVVRGAAGHAYRVPVVQVTNLVRALEQLKTLGWWVLGLSPRGETSLYDIDLPRRIVLVGGGEERGIRPLVRRSCDHLVFLPMADGVDSLNASVALGIALYEIRRRRGPGRGG